MKTYKKTMWALTLGLGVAISLLLGVGKASAANLTAPDVKNGSYIFQTSASIKGVINGQTVTFVDNDVTDNTFNYAPQGTDFCRPSGVKNFGINFASKPDNNQQVISASATLGYSTGPTCTAGPAGGVPIEVVNDNNAAGSNFQYVGANIVGINGKPIYKPFTTTNGMLYGIDTTAGNCGGDGIMLLDSPNGNTGKTYFLTTHAKNGLSTGNPAAKDYPELLPYFPLSSGCYGTYDIISGKSPAPAGLAIITGGAAGGGTPTTPGNVVADTSCEAQYTGAAHVLNWLLCPLLDGMDSIFSFINGQVEGQLNICTGVSSTTKAPCSNNLLTPQVEKSWAVFRDLATALLVVIMLIAIFAQAISVGPFDAYTIRKMLPKIIAAVILMQISWPLFKFFIDLSNDLGHGVQDLMLAPFGGTSKLGFDSLIASAGTFAPAAATLGVFSALLIGTALSGLTIMGVGLLAVTAIASVIVGLLVLLFRQMLIIMAMILAPIALLAWILPGTQKYWKLWSDNFTKLLFMFPLIMAMIAAGKIFAKIGADTGGGPLAFIIVFIGFLGPLWFLPKTFKWGGQAFAAAAGGTMNATKGLRNYPGKYAIGKAKEEREWRANQRRARLGENTSERPRLDRLLTGGYNFTRGRRHREEMLNAERAKGRKTVDEEAQNALVASEYERSDHPYKLDTLRTVAQGQRDERTGLDGSNRALQRWAMDQLATFGDWDIISELRDRNQVDERTWQMFVAKNISAIHQNAPHLSPQRTDLSQLGYEEFGQWKDLELSEYRRQFNGNGANAFVRDVQTGQLVDSTDTSNQRLRMYTKAKQALADPQVRRRMTAGGIAELEGIVSDAESGRVQIGSPEVSVTSVRDENNRPVPFAYLPADMTTPEAGRSLRREILSPQHGQVVARQIAARAADSPAGSTDEQIFKTILTEMRTQAVDPVTGVVTNPVAQTAHNTLVQEYHLRMETRAQEAQQQSFQVGHDAVQADSELTAEVGHGVDKIDSLDEDLI